MLKTQLLPALPATTSFYYDPTNLASPQTPFVPGQTQVPSTACWLNLSLTDPNLEAFLTEKYALGKNVVKNLCDSRIKSHMWSKKNAIFFSLCGFALLPATPDFASPSNTSTTILNSLPQMVILNLYFDDKILITTSSSPSFDIDKLFNVLQVDTVVTPQNLACAIMTYMLYQIEDAIANMQKCLINIEAHVGSLSITAVVHEIWEIRKHIIDHLHHFHIQEDMLSQIFYQKPAILNDADYTYFKNIVTNLDHCTSAINTTERLAVALQDKIDSLANDAMSRKLYLLSILALFIVPFTIVAGLLGMNVHIPGQSNPHAFEFIIGGCLAFSIIIFVFVRIRRWL